MAFRRILKQSALTLPPIRKLHEYAAQLSHTVAELTAELSKTRKDLQDTLGELERTHGDLQTSRRELQDAFGRKQKILDDVTADLDRTRRELEGAQIELGKTRNQLQNALGNMDSHNDVLQTAAKAAAAERDSIELEHNRLQSDFHSSVTELEKTRVYLRSREQTILTLIGERDSLLENVRDAMRERDTLITERDTLTKALQEATERPGPLQPLKSDHENLLATRSDLEISSSRLLSRLSLMSSELYSLRQLAGGAKRSSGVADGPHLTELRLRYLDLIENALTGQLYEDPPISPWSNGFDSDTRIAGRDWPMHAETMIGTARLRNVRTLLVNAIENGIEGDFLEAGVWRGGACIYARAVMAAYNVLDRKVWVADSFSGLPAPEPDLYPADIGDPHHTFQELAVSLDQVKANFTRYRLLDDGVIFLKGWFKDTLPNAPVEKLAVLRLDGDMYQSTMETLEALYSKVVPKGYIIVDDFILEACRGAVLDFRKKHLIDAAIQEIDGAGIFWQKD